MKTCKYILYALSMMLGLIACQGDDEVVLTNVSVTAKAEIAATSVYIECTVSAPNAAVSYVEVQYSTSSTFSSYEEKGMGKENGKYVVNLYNLQSHTKYYVRFLVENRYTSMLCYASGVASFTTDQIRTPSLSTLYVSDIKEQSAHVSCAVVEDGGAEVQTRGFYIRESSSNTWTSYLPVGYGVGEFSAELPLNPNTEYEVCAYATNSCGEALSNVVTFTTLSVTSAPVVTTADASEVKMYEAMLGGQVTSDGGRLVTEYGVCYSSTTSSPTVNNATGVMMGGGTGSFAQMVTGLQANTTYYVRAYAINDIGVSYGTVKSFTTASEPIVTTNGASSVTANSAVVSGSIEGGTGSRGICYGLTSNPTISDNTVYNGSGSGTYQCTLSDLQAGTTYYARAFCSSDYGVTYGDVVSFTTLQTDPVVQTVSVTSITSSSAVVNCNVASDGGHTIIERGICLSTSNSPTTSDNKFANGVGIGTYSVEVTGLASSTTYYVRAYVTTASGTVYGTTRGFTTD